MPYQKPLNDRQAVAYLINYIKRYIPHRSVWLLLAGGVRVEGVHPSDFGSVIHYADHLNVEVERDYPEHVI